MGNWNSCYCPLQIGHLGRTVKNISIYLTFVQIYHSNFNVLPSKSYIYCPELNLPSIFRPHFNLLLVNKNRFLYCVSIPIYKRHSYCPQFQFTLDDFPFTSDVFCFNLPGWDDFSVAITSDAFHPGAIHPRTLFGFQFTPFIARPI